MFVPSLTPRPDRWLASARDVVLGNVGKAGYYFGDTSFRHDDAGLDGDTVVLIHGFMQTRATMATLERRLRADGYRVVSFRLGGLLGNFNTRSIRDLGAHVHSKIERLQERYGVGPVHIIGHSMGGLIARSLVQQAGGHGYVRTVITLGTPHHGTPVAALGASLGLLFVGRALWQLFPRSSFIRELRGEPFPDGIRLVSVYSKHDIIAPWSTSVLTPRDGTDVRNILVTGLGHMDLVEDPHVYGLILRELVERPTDSASGPVADLAEEVTGTPRQAAAAR